MAGWDTRFWSFGARTQAGSWIFIAQHLAGYTSVVARGTLQATKFQSAFLLASYDIEDWRLSARGDVFQTRRIGNPTSPFIEDGQAGTLAVSWTGIANLRLAGEVIVMNSRRREYVNEGLPYQFVTSIAQLSARYSFD